MLKFLQFRQQLFGVFAIFQQLFGIPVSNFPAFYAHNRERPNSERIETERTYYPGVLQRIETMSKMWHVTPCKDESKTNQDSLGHGFWIPCFETLSYRLQSLSAFRISELNSGFQSPEFRIPRAKVSGFRNPRRITLYGARHDTNLGSLYVSGKLPTYRITIPSNV